MTRLLYSALFVAVASLASTQMAQAQQSQQPWYFGMNVALADLPGYGRVLRVNSVTYGGPAQRAGLERGDHIYMVNNARFSWANSNCQGVDILQRATGQAAGGGGGIETQVVTQPGTARMQVIDSRTGQIVPVVCYPRPNNVGINPPGVPTSQFPSNPGRPTFNPGRPTGGPFNPPVNNVKSLIDGVFRNR